MNYINQLQPGDMVFARRDLYNDGSIPNAEDDALLVKEGTRGVIINLGYLEEDENRNVILVQFENATTPGSLGAPIGCWEEDIEVRMS
ncbi:MAG: nitrogen fixation protein NifZ [Pseudomonadales bacterium]|nr:nitrogen fixation protein NifZ [Pseudomonadales bacterium]